MASTRPEHETSNAIALALARGGKEESTPVSNLAIDLHCSLRHRRRTGADFAREISLRPNPIVVYNGPP